MSFSYFQHLTKPTTTMTDNLIKNFFDYGNSITKSLHSCESTALRRFKAFFGVSPNICGKVWLEIKDKLTSDFTYKHLLWALLFLKCYNTENVNHSIVDSNEKTFREKVHHLVDKLAFLKVVISSC